jgi:hypothetical protein
MNTGNLRYPYTQFKQVLERSQSQINTDASLRKWSQRRRTNPAFRSPLTNRITNRIKTTEDQEVISSQNPKKSSDFITSKILNQLFSAVLRPGKTPIKLAS